MCRFFLLSFRNVRWPRRMLSPGASRTWVCRRDRQTDGRQSVALRFPLGLADAITYAYASNYACLINKVSPYRDETLLARHLANMPAME